MKMKEEFQKLLKMKKKLQKKINVLSDSVCEEGLMGAVGGGVLLGGG